MTSIFPIIYYLNLLDLPLAKLDCLATHTEKVDDKAKDQDTDS